MKGYPVYLDGSPQPEELVVLLPVTLAYKVPEGTWAARGSCRSCVLAVSPRRRGGWADELDAAGACRSWSLFAMSFFTDINLGLRYVLPIFPYLFIAAGKLVPWAAGMGSVLARGRRRARSSLGLAATVAATRPIHPHYLAYFNRASGGPDRGRST